MFHKGIDQLKEARPRPFETLRASKRNKEKCEQENFNRMKFYCLMFPKDVF